MASSLNRTRFRRRLAAISFLSNISLDGGALHRPKSATNPSRPSNNSSCFVKSNGIEDAKKILYYSHQNRLQNGSAKENIPHNGNGFDQGLESDPGLDEEAPGHFSEPEEDRTHLMHTALPQAEPLCRIQRRQTIGKSPDRLSESSDSDSLRIGLKSVASTPLRDSYEIMAEDLAHLYRHLGITKAALMGHSMGGRNVMYFALQYPELVEKAIIVDITQYYKSAHSKEVITMLKVLRDLKLDNSINLSEGRKMADEALKPVVPEKGTRDFVLLNLTKNADNNFEWRINLEGLQQNVTDNILKFPQKILAKKFTGPTLFVCGKESNYVSEKDVAKVKINFPRTQFEFIEKAGHLVHVDSPARFIDVTTKFLNEK